MTTAPPKPPPWTPRYGILSALAVLSCAGPAVGVSDEAGAATDANAAVTNHALHFDGKSSYATTGTASFPLSDSAQTVSLWVRYSQGSGIQNFVTMRRENQSGTQFGIRNGVIAVSTIYEDRVFVQTPTLPAINTWHHVAYVFDPNVPNWTAMIYVDGALAASAGAIPDNLTPYSCWLGSLDGVSRMYLGDLDEIRIWAMTRTRAQIMQDRNGQVDPASPALIAYFSCDAVVGSRVIDQSGTGNDMTLGGGDPMAAPSLVISTVP